jgi:predicted nuclease of predicted toxin-antitoxin system
VDFVADEGLDKPIVEELRRLGHEVIYIAETSPGASDREVLAHADSRQAVLLTTDTDFGELVFRQRLSDSGVVLVRLAGLSIAEKVRIVRSAVREHATEMPAAFTVVRAGSVRVRRRF